MPKKGENIHKRKDGRWEGRYMKGRNVNGKIIYGSVYAKTYREAKEKLKEINKNPEYYKESVYKEKIFKEVLVMWMDNNRIRYKGATINKYQYLIDTHILPELGNEKISYLTATKINTFLTKKLSYGRLDQTGGLSASYVRSIMLIIQSALKFAAEEQMCLPLKTSICKPILEKKDLCILDIYQQRKLEEYLSIDADHTKIGIFISLHTGMRIGEICALSWDNIDFSNNIIHVRSTIARVRDDTSEKSNSKLILDTPKTLASIRDIPISTYLLTFLSQMKKHAKSSFVVSDKLSFVSPRTYEYRFHKILKECGLPSINYHALRHTFATRCIEAGVDVKSLSEILGHANVGITLNTYVHSSIEMKRQQLEKMDALCVNEKL